jgi:hypothetical protein
MALFMANPGKYDPDTKPTRTVLLVKFEITLILTVASSEALGLF